MVANSPFPRGARGVLALLLLIILLALRCLCADPLSLLVKGGQHQRDEGDTMSKMREFLPPLACRHNKETRCLPVNGSAVGVVGV